MKFVNGGEIFSLKESCQMLPNSVCVKNGYVCSQKSNPMVVAGSLYALTEFSSQVLFIKKKINNNKDYLENDGYFGLFVFLFFHVVWRHMQRAFYPLQNFMVSISVPSVEGGQSRSVLITNCLYHKKLRKLLLSFQG